MGRLPKSSNGCRFGIGDLVKFKKGVYTLGGEVEIIGWVKRVEEGVFDGEYVVTVDRLNKKWTLNRKERLDWIRCGLDPDKCEEEHNEITAMDYQLQMVKSNKLPLWLYGSTPPGRLLVTPQAIHLCGVYAIQECGTNRVKVGSSNNIVTRLRTLQTGNSNRLIWIASMPSHPNYLLVNERDIHKELAKCKIHTEWFRLTAKTARVLDEHFCILWMTDELEMYLR